RFGRNGWADNHGLGSTGDARDRSDIADEIEVELLVKRRITRVWKTNQEKRVAIRGRIHDGLSGDVGTCTRPVLDDELLACPLRKPLTDQTGNDVISSAGGKPDNPAYRTRRIGLRPRDPRRGRQRRSTRCQMQEFAAGKFHFEPPSRF